MISTQVLREWRREFTSLDDVFACVEASWGEVGDDEYPAAPSHPRKPPPPALAGPARVLVAGEPLRPRENLWEEDEENGRKITSVLLGESCLFVGSADGVLRVWTLPVAAGAAPATSVRAFEEGPATDLLRCVEGLAFVYFWSGATDLVAWSRCGTIKRWRLMGGGALSSRTDAIVDVHAEDDDGEGGYEDRVPSVNCCVAAETHGEAPSPSLVVGLHACGSPSEERGDGNIVVFDAATGAQRETWRGHTTPVIGIVVVPRGFASVSMSTSVEHLILWSSAGVQLRVIELGNHAWRRALRAQRRPPTRAVDELHEVNGGWCLGDDLVLVGDQGDVLRILDAETLQTKRSVNFGLHGGEYGGHSGHFTVAVAGTANRFVVANEDSHMVSSFDDDGVDDDRMPIRNTALVVDATALAALTAAPPDEGEALSTVYVDGIGGSDEEAMDEDDEDDSDSEDSLTGYQRESEPEDREGKHRHDVAGRLHFPLTKLAGASHREGSSKGPTVIALDGSQAVAGYADGTVVVAGLLEATPDARVHAPASFLTRNLWDNDYTPGMEFTTLF